MNTRGLLVTIFAVALSVAPQLVSTSSADGTYSATLISPRAGQVLYPGQKIMVEWKSTLPHMDLTGCEREVWLSLDGGTTYIFQVTPSMDPRTTFFYWVVPNTPTNAAVLDIRYGCEPFYPDTRNAQTASPFVIANAGGQ